MTNLKVKVIDRRKERRESICDAIRDWNSLGLGEACLGSVFDQKGNIVNEEITQPDIFLLHLDDQVIDGRSHGYVEQVNKSRNTPLIVLYSGGEIVVEEYSDARLIGHQGVGNGKAWGFEAHDTSRICIILRPVNSADDLNIALALEKYVISRNREEFFHALREASPSTEYLSALAILCQGYLMAHYPTPNNCSPSVGEALTKMAGLQGGDVSKSLDRAYQKRGDTEKPAWWGRVFGRFSEQSDEEEEREIEKKTLLNFLATEYRTVLPQKVKELVERIYHAEKLNDDDLVAEAFLQIYNRLTRGT